MSDKTETAEVPRGRVSAAPKSMTQNPRAWLEGLRYVESMEAAAKCRDRFGVRGIALAEQLQIAGHAIIEKTTVLEAGGDVSHYLVGAKEAGK